MSNQTIKNIIEKVRYHGAGTINSLIYGNVNESTYDFLCRGNEGGTHTEHRRVCNEHTGNIKEVSVYVRNDSNLCSEINGLVRAGILKKFLPNGIDWNNYRTTWFYRIDDDYVEQFESKMIPDYEINRFIRNHCQKSTRKVIVSTADRTQTCLANIAVNHFGYKMRTLKDLIDSGETQDPGIYERCTKNGSPLSDLLSGASSYFESVGICELNTETKVKLFREFMEDREGVLKKYDEKCKRNYLINEMERNNVMGFYKEHKDTLLEFIKRNNELEKMTSIDG